MSVGYQQPRDAQLEAIEKAATSAYYKRWTEYERIYAAILSLSQLPDGWDSYDAPPPSDAAIASALKLLGGLTSLGLLPDRSVPTADGGVGLLFDSGQKHAYIEVSNESEFSVGVYSKSSALDVSELSPSCDAALEAKQLVLAFFER